MKDYKVEISIYDNEEEIHQTFYIEASSFEEAINNLEYDLDVSLR